VSAVEIRVDTERLDCKNGTMNEHMLKALKAKTNPTIVFKLASYDLAKQAEAVRVTLNGTLSMGGVEKPISLTANATEGSSGMLHVVGMHELRMTEWGLKPPTLMLGTMKVDERVKIGFDLLLKD
jgi:polyisoprenoid-binding protein YceI